MKVFSVDEHRVLIQLGITCQDFSYEDAVAFSYAGKRVVVYRDGVRLWNVYSLKGWRKFHESSSALKYVVGELTEDEFISS